MQMKHMSAVMVLLALAASTLPAQAQDKYYIDASLGLLTSDVKTFDTFNTQNIFVRVGKQITRSVAVEGLLGAGVGTDSWTDGCDTQEVSTDSFIGAQVVGSMPMSRKTRLRGTLGYLLASASIKNSGAASCYGGFPWSEEYSEDKASFSYGLGMDYKLNKQSAITADYQVFFNDTISGIDVNISGFLIGYKHSF